MDDNNENNGNATLADKAKAQFGPSPSMGCVHDAARCRPTSYGDWD